ncbi:SufE family protein [Prolixibacter denitrificans]|uniref:Cysteine desulfuration protein SufE n=1 Tax=Prolixibacter denitrificans TaxID=1541063 RepID=A0A2P8CIC3_9BACT|nr:SufE family protein [Prolixibacter denitrificans]PSK84689.1 cysteine desulfuration protein SufE [Prolixibacter denitrificans]GET20855.1 Fe-S metabolism protein SufE [Prolixibacter denitrificans]
MTIEDIQQEIIEEFSVFEDWMDKYAYLIELGNELEPIDAKYKIDDNLIRGCQSRVWLHPEKDGDKILFEAESDAIIVKGLVALLLRVLSNRSPREIIDADLHFIDDIGLKQHLSPTRSNGLLAMVKQMKLYALAYEKLSQQEG